MKYSAVIFDFEGTIVHGDKLYSDVFGLISKLKARGILLGIASNTSVHSIRERLEKNKMLHYFDTIVGIDTVDFVGKPAPDVFLRAVEHLGAQPEDCLVIEDSVTGVEGATAAGISTILIRGEKHPNAFYVCKDLQDEELNRILFL
ncbi:MAG TPA: HAD family hydrolase [Candidatus Magasanikbacteria bacterium]|nr:HAD family hydrolase [Candidatus Magasanikbacteria bacterium]